MSVMVAIKKKKRTADVRSGVTPAVTRWHTRPSKRNPAQSPKTKRGFYFHQWAWVDSNYRPHAYQI